jgi:pilus assembly protein CpaB
MNRRMLTIGLAVALAILGTVGVLIYVNGANDRALTGQQAVTVFVADKRITAGTSAHDAQSQGLLRTERLPAANVPSDTLSSIGPDIEALTASADVQPGQLLLRSMLRENNAPATGGLSIRPGEIAVTVALCASESVGGYVNVGSHVAVFDTAVVTGDGALATDAKAQPGCDAKHEQQGIAVTKLLLADVQVLAIGPAPAGSANGTQTTNATGSSGSASTDDKVLVTVTVGQADAERLILATQTGLPYLALRAEDSKVAQSNGFNTGMIFQNGK